MLQDPFHQPIRLRGGHAQCISLPVQGLQHFPDAFIGAVLKKSCHIIPFPVVMDSLNRLLLRHTAVAHKLFQQRRAYKHFQSLQILSLSSQLTQRILD